MHRDGNRTQRVASTIQHQLAALLCEAYPELQNKLFSVMYVHVSPDLSLVDVYCSCLEGEDIVPLIEILTEDAKKIRYELAQCSSMKKIPALRFHADKVQDTSRKIDTLLKQVGKQ